MTSRLNAQRDSTIDCEASARQDRHIIPRPGSGAGIALRKGLESCDASPDVTVYFTTGGQTNPPGVTGSVAGAVLEWLTQAISVTVGDQPATVSLDGSAPTFVDGVDQLNIQLSQNTPSGAQPIVITIGGISEFEILYAIDVAASKSAAAIVVELFSRTRKKNREWSVLKGFKVTPAQAGSLPDPADAEAVAAILGGQEYLPYGYYSTNAVTRKALRAELALKLIPMIAATGRLRWRTDTASMDLHTAAWDPQLGESGPRPAPIPTHVVGDPAWFSHPKVRRAGSGNLWVTDWSQRRD